MISGIKKDVGMGLLVLSLYNMSCLHTAIPTPSFCGFWHGHPYIPLHFLKMFLYFVLYNLSVNVIIMAIVYITSWETFLTEYKEVAYLHGRSSAGYINAPVLLETYSTYTCMQLHLLQVRLILADHKTSYYVPTSSSCHSILTACEVILQIDHS